MDKLKSLMRKLGNYEDTSVNPNEPRNIAAKYLNPYLPEALNIPELTVGQRNKQLDSLLSPEGAEEAVLGAGMGGIGKASLELKPFSKELAAKISDAFKNMEHNPNSPEVKKAYDALIKETTEQYDKMIANGLKVDKIAGENPYKSSKDLIDSVTKTNEIKYFPTEQGFGTGSIKDNPLLQKTGRMNASGDEMLANDLFRVVHDYHGHVKPKSSFGPKGEEIAYQYHKTMFSPEAQKALATETRGQNSFVNFGDNAINNRLNPENTIYAEQKIGLLPDWAINENAASTVVAPNPASYSGLANALKLKKQDN